MGPVPASSCGRTRSSPSTPATRPSLRALGFPLAQAHDRLAAAAAERRVTALELGLSETLQRSLLPEPVQRQGLEVAVRYRPAAEQAQVGGDWYDSFLDPQGRLLLVVGDVTGHDQLSAAAMAQVRNLLRGVAWERDAGPAGVLAGVDRAVTGLRIGVLASAVVARVEEDGAARRLRWSNAGHPPPVLLEPDGRPRLLETQPEALLGMSVGTRSDHLEDLQPGSTVVIYSDGLVERPGAIIDEGFAWLTGFLEGRQGDSAEAIGEALLVALRPDVADDVVVLVLRVTPPS